MEGDFGEIVYVMPFSNDDERNQQNSLFYFEQYENILEQNKHYSIISFNRQRCFSLQMLFDALNSNYIKLYEGQLFQISLMILKHYEELHAENLYHGNLSSKNIILQLKQNSKQFASYVEEISISKVYFIKYDLQKCNNSYITDILQQEDFSKIKSIIFTILQFIKSSFCRDYDLLNITSKGLQELSDLFCHISKKILINQNKLNFYDNDFEFQKTQCLKNKRSHKLMKEILIQYNQQLQILAETNGFDYFSHKMKIDTYGIKFNHFQQYDKIYHHQQFKSLIFLLYQSNQFEIIKQQLFECIGNQISNNQCNKKCQDIIELCLMNTQQFLGIFNSIYCEIVQHHFSNYEQEFIIGSFYLKKEIKNQFLTQLVRSQLLESNNISCDSLNQLKQDVINKEINMKQLIFLEQFYVYQRKISQE